MRFVIGLTLVCLLGVAAAQVGYYPSQPGLTWTFSNGETQSIGSARDFNGQTATVLLHSLQGAPIAEDYLVYDAQGARLLGTAAGGQILTYSPFLTLYPPPPLQVGQSWTSTATVDDLEISLAFEILGVTGVQTAAGRFNALQIRQQTITSTGGQTFLDLFFVPSVGIVRTVTQDGTQIDLIEKNF